MGRIWISWVVLIIFTLAHILSKWSSHREVIAAVNQGRPASEHVKPHGLWGYISKQAPAKTPMGILCSIGLGLVLWDMGSFNVVTALTSGWSSMSMVNKLTDLGKKMI